MTKEFDSDEDAEKYYTKQEASKRKGGYCDAEDPDGNSGSPRKNKKGTITPKRKAAAAASMAAKTATPTKKTGLGGFAAPDAAASGSNVVDSGVAGIDGALASRVHVHETYHARLALVDTAANSDKYYILQVLIDERPPKKKKGKKAKNGSEYYLFTRWGRTGTGGQAKMEGPFDDEDDANTAFEKVFKSKTAVNWGKAVAGEEAKPGKYEYLVDAEGANEDAQWYYYLRNDPLGKADGWYKYDEENSREVEDLHSIFLASKKAGRLAKRVVTSESSGFQYMVDLSRMQQTNTSSGKTRPIERTDNGKPPRGAAARASASPKKALTLQQIKSAAMSPSTPTSNIGSVVAVATPSKIAGAVDKLASAQLKRGTVYEDYNVMLNQTNLGANNNKFYKIQLIQCGSSYHLFSKWGRVGEDGKTQEQGPFADIEKAQKEFAKKFKAKSSNSWESYQEDKNSFVSKKGKYTVVEMEQDDEAASAMAAASASNKPIAKSELDPDTKDLVDLIFDEDMFKSAMTDLNLDPKKLPLGALSQTQIAKGFAVLERLEDAINNNASDESLGDITSEFYTLIPHAFGRTRGPVIDNVQKVQEKYDLLNTLADIEAAQTMQKTKKENSTDDDDKHQPNPSDLNYKQLAADLVLLDKMDRDFKLIRTYFDDTKDNRGYGGVMELQKVWRVNRQNEETRFAKHASIERRKLLWHGTNVAVVAAILKSGLRIMPHSEAAWAEKGIYLADQHQKSAWYTRSARGTTIMFLIEAALGNAHEILNDDPSLTAAPKGFDSVLAKGSKAPPKEKELKIDGNSVAVPQGKPMNVASAAGSSFAHNEFLLYQESQHRIRYILSFGPSNSVNSSLFGDSSDSEC
eukprot:CAMPEP_0183707052 /NCGR_PEP_ID=MMETSP0737-20130205/3729_1 /TAXON_ID=385413 /ORGANISM="Thalassiosira miniscula, Strain CCMP1093" /LENGTH=859 /DNA_ID=CAMNT_0025934623 /DNA_START=219 /DNA_END=2799 /DNA_ORIENTATION=+